MKKITDSEYQTNTRQLGRREFLKSALLFLGASVLTFQAACRSGVVNTGGATSATPGTTTVNGMPGTTNTAIVSGTANAATPILGVADIARPFGWTKLSHSNNVAPDYSTVFPQDKVNRMKITISPDNWNAMQTNLQELFGSGSQGNQPGGPFPGGGQPGWFNPGAVPIPPEFNQPEGAPIGLPGGGGGDMTSENPAWVPCTIEFNGLTWTNVGVRYKGNSSLRSGWGSGDKKLPLKLDFDQYEIEHPEIDNQRFFGFKQLSLSNAFSDNSYMRDPLSYDLLEESGLPASQTAYYQVILEYGQGEVDLGIYVVIEVIDDTAIARYFGEKSGNIYEGDGSGVSLAAGVTSVSIESSFKKENNPDTDWSDIKALYDALHANNRTGDAPAWRVGLEKVFDVDAFLEWLAISAIIQNWDNYGSMTHNFYLYHDPDTGRLVWISWDHNMVLGVGGGGGDGGMVFGGVGGGGGLGIGGAGGGGGMGIGGQSTSLDKKDVGNNWPLIRFLLDDPVYYQRYLKYMKELVNGPFTVDKMKAKTESYAALLKPYSDQTSLNQAVQQLLSTVAERVQAAQNFLGTQQ